jgi:sugar phosphate isomerase/epimerase
LDHQILLGLVTDVVPLDEIVDGWDYYEIPNGVHIIPMESEANWAKNREMYLKRGVPTPVASHYIGGLGTYAAGPGYDREQQLFWAERSFRRMNEMGVRVVGVWGGFFRCPEDYGRANAVDDAVSFCNIVADQAERYGITVALEPNADPDTLFPSYKEGLNFAKSTGRRSIKVMADLNYFLKLHEPLETIYEDPEYCVHVQMAGEGNGFSQPNIKPRTEAYDTLFTILKNIGYHSTVSVAPVHARTTSEAFWLAVVLSVLAGARNKLADKLSAAVVTEWHPFNVIDFQELFTNFAEFDTYIQSLELLAQDEENQRGYNVVVFYNLSVPTPDRDDRRRNYLVDCLGQANQGIVLLHHAIVNYPDWPFWDEISGVGDRAFKYFPEQEVQYRVETGTEHPVVQGVDDFAMVDETYIMAEPSADNEVLLTTQHANSLRAIAWARQYEQSRVFCYQSGHDRSAYRDGNFQAVLKRGMLWAAGISL